jgi:histidyl-tRNA synthetase
LVDVEVIALGWRFFQSLGLRQVTLRLNSLGEPADRQRYTEALRQHFTAHSSDLAEETRATLVRNPLRVLDSKRAEDADVLKSAPRIDDFFSPAAAEHFDRVRVGLDALGIPYTRDERLVRGLDYYRFTTFEYAGGTLDSAQNALGGGGRYDGLVEDLGGPATPGIGFALGLDRTLLACDDEGVFAASPSSVDVFVIDTTGGLEATVLTDEFRSAGLRADRAYDNRSMKSQMKAADRSNARVAVIIGTDEQASQQAVVRPMNGGEQFTVSRSSLLDSVLRVVRTSEPSTTPKESQ